MSSSFLKKVEKIFIHRIFTLKYFRIPLDKANLFCYNRWAHGRLAQLGEHLPYKQRVIGSSPILSTKKVLEPIRSVCKWQARTETVVNDSPADCQSRRRPRRAVRAANRALYFPPRRFSFAFKNGLVAQLVRALACHARGRGFEPHPSRHSCMPL